MVGKDKRSFVLQSTAMHGTFYNNFVCAMHGAHTCLAFLKKEQDVMIPAVLDELFQIYEGHG